VHHVVVERWSRGSSPLHARDARAKLGALLIFLIALATTPHSAYFVFAAYATLLSLAIETARLPIKGLAARATIVLPFSLVFAAISWIAGDPDRAAALVIKSFLSALAVLLLVSTTPLERLAAAMESLGVPRILVLVTQFLYRYLFVISEQAQHMRLAAECRGGLRKRLGFRAAGGAIGVLFGRSYERAEGIHRAMLARGFSGHYSFIAANQFSAADGMFVFITAAVMTLIRVI
jgi:cobalt/nickel transport system permease protein